MGRRFGLIGASLAVCLALLAAYAALVARGLPAWAERPESQWSGNRAAAEAFVHLERAPDTVIVGSSMAQRLEAGMFRGEVYNLAFSGQSVFDGLRILARSGMAPRLVLVETNVLEHAGDPGLVDDLFAAPGYQLAHALPVLREPHRPLNTLKWQALALARLLLMPPAAHAGGEQGRPGPLFDALVAHQVAARATPLAPEATADRLADLKALVDTLRRRGSAVVLFEMPAHPAVCASPAATAMRRAVAGAFPRPDYRRLPAPDCARYRTTDGTHLPPSEARRFARELAAALARPAR